MASQKNLEELKTTLASKTEEAENFSQNLKKTEEDKSKILAINQELETKVSQMGNETLELQKKIVLLEIFKSKTETDVKPECPECPGKGESNF